jgi:N-acetylglucosaminyldiphosphoundecaprenol N-acetyl-beta-D-mannosaminyltransferase
MYRVRDMGGGRSTVSLFGYEICNGGVARQAELALSFVNGYDSGHYMACANPHSLVVASRDPTFREALRGASILLPDGAGIVLASRILGLPMKERIAGADFFLAVSEALNKQGGARYFFLGSTTRVLDLIVKRIAAEYPAITVCGTYSPPFRAEFSEEDNETMREAVNAANPDVLWVGMTAPKQENWIYSNRERLHVPLSAAIGAVFDFYAGTKRRSSPFWQRLGLEWLPRFLREPRRLWQRNLKSTPIFLFWVLREKARLRFFQSRGG